MVGAGDASYENRMLVRADMLGTSRPGDRSYENRMMVRADAPGPFAAWRPLLRKPNGGSCRYARYVAAWRPLLRKPNVDSCRCARSIRGLETAPTAHQNSWVR